MKRFMIAASVLAVGACQWIPGTDAHAIEAAKGLVAAELRDPASAQFLDMRVVEQSNGSTAVCGKVNGKNAFGAHVGFKGFYTLDGRVVMEPSPSVTSYEGATEIYQWAADKLRVCVLSGEASASGGAPTP